jgi:hypothetical protein
LGYISGGAYTAVDKGWFSASNFSAIDLTNLEKGGSNYVLPPASFAVVTNSKGGCPIYNEAARPKISLLK